MALKKILADLVVSLLIKQNKEINFLWLNKLVKNFFLMIIRIWNYLIKKLNF